MNYIKLCNILLATTVFTQYSYSFAPRITYTCWNNPYEAKICIIYKCSETSSNTQNKSIISSCKIFLPVYNNVKNNVFPDGFDEFGNGNTSFYKNLDITNQRKKFCTGFFEDYGHGNVHYVGSKSDDHLPNISITMEKRNICYVNEPKLNNAVRLFQMISAFISPIFIFLPIVVFILTREIQNVHSYAHFTNACCVFALYFSWGFRYVYFRGDVRGTDACFYFGAIQHYLHLSVFSWLVVGNYDLLKLSDAHVSATTLDTNKQISLYTHLSLFAWGIPAIYLTVLAIISWFARKMGMKELSNLSLWLMPEYGRYRCFIGFKAYWLHLVLPCAILLTVAFFYMFKTLRILRKKHHETKEHAYQKVNVLRNLACLKVMVIASLCWGCDILRSFMTAYDRSALLWLRVIFDTLIMYQTIPIFVIYTCRPHILNQLELKYPLMTATIAVIRKFLRVPAKEDARLVTELRVHQKSGANLYPPTPITERFTQHQESAM